MTRALMLVKLLFTMFSLRYPRSTVLTSKHPSQCALKIPWNGRQASKHWHFAQYLPAAFIPDPCSYALFSLVVPVSDTDYDVTSCDLVPPSCVCAVCLLDALFPRRLWHSRLWPLTPSGRLTPRSLWLWWWRYYSDNEILESQPPAPT